MSDRTLGTADKNLKKVVALCYEMLELADHGDKFRQDDVCRVVFGVLRDAAYKVRRMAEEELSQHGTQKRRAPD